MNNDPIRIDFCDFGAGYSKTDNYFHAVLKRRFNVDLTDNPDFLIFQDAGRHVHRLHTCVRIFSGVEWWPPDWSECDYALTSNYIDHPRHLRLPFYAQTSGAKMILKDGEAPADILREKTGFCSFVVSAHHSVKNARRADFFQKLCKYKKVDSGGRAFNNIGEPLPPGQRAKLNFLRRYKFNICFENESHEGYTTEKICDAMMARTIPIYWGNPRIAEEFNPKSFINCFDYPNDEAVIERIIELDRDDSKYLEVVAQPYFHNNQPNEVYDHSRLLDFFGRIFTTPIKPVGQRRQWFQLGRWILAKKLRPGA